MDNIIKGNEPKSMTNANHHTEAYGLFGIAKNPMLRQTAPKRGPKE